MKRFVAITAALWLLFGAVAGAQPYTESEGSLTVEPNTIAAGDEVTVSGDGFAPGSEAEVVLVIDGAEGQASASFGSGAAGTTTAAAALGVPAVAHRASLAVTELAQAGNEIVLGTATVDDDGSFEIVVTIPEDFTGDGVLFARGTGPDGATRVLGVRITNGSVGELAFTGASSRTGTLVTIAIGLVVGGSAALIAGRRLRTA